jgi:hypothetical protein
VLSQLHPAALCTVDQPLDGNRRGSSSSGAQDSAVRVYGVEYELHALQSVYQPACSSNGSLSVYSNSTSGRKAVPSATGKDAASGATSGNDSNVNSTAERGNVSSGSAPTAVTAVATTTTGSKEKDKEAKQLGSTGSLSWTGDLPELRGSLRGFGNQIKLLEEEHRKKVQLVHQLKKIHYCYCQWFVVLSVLI